MSLVPQINVKYQLGGSMYPISLLEDAFQPEVHSICAYIPERGICEWTRINAISSNFNLQINGCATYKNIIMTQEKLLDMFEKNKFVQPHHF
jgi:hypothetical protein